MRIRFGVRAFVWVFLMLIFPMVSWAVSASFEDVERSLLKDGYWNGSDESGGIRSGDLFFVNAYNTDWDSWSGFSVSEKQDTWTPGYANQYSAIPGEGAGGSATYAVAYQGMQDTELILDSPDTLAGFYVTNTTYAYLSMKNGDDFAKKFGPGDWFKLTIKGVDAEEKETGSVEIYLADFRESGNFLLKDWRWVDLAALGRVKRLTFHLDSTDEGDWGMNTPAYFALDNVGGPKLVDENGEDENGNPEAACFIQVLGF